MSWEEKCPRRNVLGGEMSWEKCPGRNILGRETVLGVDSSWDPSVEKGLLEPLRFDAKLNQTGERRPLGESSWELGPGVAKFKIKAIHGLRVNYFQHSTPTSPVCKPSECSNFPSVQTFPVLKLPQCLNCPSAQIFRVFKLSQCSNFPSA